MTKSMFKTHSLLLGFLLLFCSPLAAQKTPKIKGNRTVAPYSNSLETFHTVVLEEDLKINIVASDTTGVAILADDNLPPVFKFQVTDSVLHISTYYNITSFKQLDITLYTPILDQVNLVAGEIGLTLDPRFESTKVQANNGSILAVGGTVPHFSLFLDGKAFATINGFFEILDLEMKDRTTATIYADVSENAAVTLLDKSGVKWGGTLAHLTAAFTGNIDFNALELEINEAMVNAAGKSRIDLYVISHLTYFAKEESQLDLYGQPKIDLMEFSGTAQLRKKLLK